MQAFRPDIYRDGGLQGGEEDGDAEGVSKKYVLTCQRRYSPL